MTAVVFAALVWKVVDWLRLLFNLPRQVSAVVTQALAWVAGVLLVWVASSASVTAEVVLPGTSAALGTLDAGSVILVGLLVSSFGSAIVDVKQALDRTDSAAKPPLVGDAPGQVVAPS